MLNQYILKNLIYSDNRMQTNFQLFLLSTDNSLPPYLLKWRTSFSVYRDLNGQTKT